MMKVAGDNKWRQTLLDISVLCQFCDINLNNLCHHCVAETFGTEIKAEDWVNKTYTVSLMLFFPFAQELLCLQQLSLYKLNKTGLSKSHSQFIICNNVA